MASPTLLTCPQAMLFSVRYSSTPAIQPVTTAGVPSAERVGRCNSLVEMVVPSSHTPPNLDMVAPQSVPMKTCRLSLIHAVSHDSAGWFHEYCTARLGPEDSRLSWAVAGPTEGGRACGSGHHAAGQLSGTIEA